MSGSSMGDLPLGSEPSRRDLLRTGIAGPLGLLTVGPNRSGSRDACAERSIILLLLVGGPSHFETWDPKPDAPAEVRGPFRPIATNVPGVFISEHLPRLSRCVDRLTVIRSLHHESAPIHETGLQLVQTGRVCPGIGDYPHFGSVVARLLGARNGVPPFVVLPHPIGNTGLGLSRGQSAGRLGAEFSPVTLVAEPVCSTEDVRPIPAWARAVLESDAEPRRIPAAYGGTAFGRSCLGARRLVEAGVRVVTVNMYPTVVNRATWDCHGARPFSSFEDYARVVLPTFDRAVSALIRDLEARESGVRSWPGAPAPAACSAPVMPPGPNRSIAP